MSLLIFDPNSCAALAPLRLPQPLTKVYVKKVIICCTGLTSNCNGLLESHWLESSPLISKLALFKSAFSLDISSDVSGVRGGRTAFHPLSLL